MIVDYPIALGVISEPSAIESVVSSLGVLLIGEEVTRFEPRWRWRRVDIPANVGESPVGDWSAGVESSIVNLQYFQGEEEYDVPARDIHALVHILRLPNHFVTIATRVKIRKQQRLIQIVSSGSDINPNIVLRGVYNASHCFLSPFEGLERSMNRAGGCIAAVDRYVEVCADESD